VAAVSDSDVIIVGAGPCGVASALALKDLGVRSLVVDRAEAVASAWRIRYDRLRLNTARPLSHLPDRPFAKGTPMFPTRDDLVRHIDVHAKEEGLEFRFGTHVDWIDRDAGAWALRTGAGVLRAPQVIVATGYQNDPVTPAWPGRDDFEGWMLHAAEYRNADPFGGERVLVVGPGCSGMEIADELARCGAAKVWLAVRTPPNMILREGPGGLPGDMLGAALLHLPARIGDAVTRFGRKAGIGDLTEHGLPVPDEGVMSRLHRLGTSPSIVDEQVIQSIRGGAIEIVASVEALERRTVCLADGSRLEPDVVICATGYRCGLEPLVGHLGVLDAKGRPRTQGERPAAPGLRFIGYLPRPGALGYWGKQAKRAAKAISREFRSGSP
jgi:cation diffusion facilitator CzcD-associated flavoprotein CzcO